jgi:DNA-binding transcriptional MerR regulator
MDKDIGAYRTISEVAEELDLPQHVLRFWETRFPQIKPMKRSGGRRYYRPPDVLLLGGIRHLLYGQGYTIKGVQRILAAQGVGAVQQIGVASAADVSVDAGLSPQPAAEDSSPTQRQDDVRGYDDTPHEPDAIEAPIQDQSPVDDHPPPAAIVDRVAAGPIRSRATPVLDHRRVLRDALEDLVECRRLLSALDDVESGPSEPEQPS